MNRAWSPRVPVHDSSTFFPLHFQSFPDPEIRIRPAPVLTSNRRHAYPTPTRRPTRHRLPFLPIPRLSHAQRRPGDPTVCVTKLSAIPATRGGTSIYPHTRNPPSSRVLRHNAPSPGRCHARRPGALASERAPPATPPATTRRSRL